MDTAIPRPLIEIAYFDAAQAYLRSLPPEHFMEASAQATQRKITLESLDLVHGERPDIQVFNELLVQYPRPRMKRPGQVVPDNMVVVWNEPIVADGSFDVPLQPAGPFWVLEYVSKSNKRKDYEDNFKHYEKSLKVPYFLLFYPDTQDLSLYHYRGKKYRSVLPNDHGRHPIPELELEVAILDDWVRFWFRDKLLPLPAEMQRELARVTRLAAAFEQRLTEEQAARLAAERELERLRAQLGEKNGKT